MPGRTGQINRTSINFSKKGLQFLIRKDMRDISDPLSGDSRRDDVGLDAKTDHVFCQLPYRVNATHKIVHMFIRHSFCPLHDHRFRKSSLIRVMVHTENAKIF